MLEIGRVLALDLMSLQFKNQNLAVKLAIFYIGDFLLNVSHFKFRNSDLKTECSVTPGNGDKLL